jgi:glucose/arabinose dehydrogenase
MRRLAGSLALLAATMALAAGPAGAAPAADPPALQRIARVESPTYLTGQPGTKRAMYVIERLGRVRVIFHGRLLRRSFLNIRRRVKSEWIEQGLLAVAFPPDFPKTGLYYVQYTDRRGDIRIDEFRRNPRRPLTTIMASRRTVLRIPQIAEGGGHNGGQMRFLGRDLYIAIGDGNNPGDARNVSQNLESLRGKILRINPRADETNGRSYRIPAGNPFVGLPGRDEIFAYGLRNPHSFAFYTPPGGERHMVITDVGQGRYEEVNYLPFSEAAGANFGWKIYEGLSPYDCGPELCPNGGPAVPDGPLVSPQYVYSRDVGCAVIGGPVIADRALPALSGRLVWGDFCSGTLTTATPRTDSFTDVTPLGVSLPAGRAPRAPLNSIGEDGFGRLYFLSNNGGVFRLIARGTLRR